MPVFPRYPEAEWVPWRYTNSVGQVTFYANVMSKENPPRGAVLHIAEGYTSTARQWAINGHYGASWTFWVGRDGHVLQHLDMEHGGYHAGITDAQAAASPPTWARWRGRGINVNSYTVGIEHEGFANDRGFTPAQAESSIRLCRWLAGLFGWEWGDRSRFPPHADIDLINRVNDFGYPDVREAHYARMFASPPTQEVDDVTEAEVRALLAPYEGRIASLEEANANLENRITRLNGALVDRMWLRRIADDPDYSNVEATMAELREAGIIS